MSHITVIDDSVEFTETVRDVFSGAGHEVTAFGSFEVGMEELCATQPDLLILDLRLGTGRTELSGWEFLLLCRGHEQLRSVPVIICSADFDQLRQHEAELQQMVDVRVLPKPFGLDELELVVAESLASPAGETNGGSAEQR